jgi:glucosamine-6-phosphate deaminase
VDIVILADAERVANEGARRIAALLKKKPAAVLGLATGSTPLKLYGCLIADHRRGAVSFAKVTTFNLDEYVGLGVAEPQSYRSYMQREFFDHIDIQSENTFLPTCDDAAGSIQVGLDYEERIRSKAGIDLQVLGIGQNGHIGFNEPSSSLRSRTRLKTLTRETLAANRQYFSRPDTQPQLAITMGVATIMDAGEIVLLATGASKAQAVCAAIEGPLSASCPASVLQMHPNVSFLLDEEAAADLSMRDYYDWVQQQKQRLNVAMAS